MMNRHLPMILRHITLTNFRCFESLSLDLDEELNIFIGGNGAGKTTVLDAIALCLVPVLNRLPKPEKTAKPPQLLPGDIHLTKEDNAAPYLQISATARTNDPEPLRWDRHKLRDNSPSTKAKLSKDRREMKELYSYVDKITDAHNESKPYVLPVFAYYGTNRAVDVPHNKIQDRVMPKFFKRTVGLDGSLDAQTNFRRAVSWFDFLEQRELRIQREGNHHKPLPELEAVRQAIQATIPDIKRPRIDEDTGRFVVDSPVGDRGAIVKLYLDQLSDGYQVMLGVVMDFALRLALANPPVSPNDNPLTAEAILMIDEVDLHLHPEWQQNVIPDLRRAFPNTQLILTTHSPQVITTVEARFVRKIEKHQFVPLLFETQGAESNRVLEAGFNVNPRPESLPVVGKLAKYLKLIESPDADVNLIQKLRAELAQELSPDDPALEVADITLEHRKLLGELKLTLPPLPNLSQKEG